MDAHPEHNGQSHWESCARLIARSAEELMAVAGRERKNKGIHAATRDLLWEVRDNLNEVLGRYMEEEDVEECALEDELMDLFSRMKAILDKEQKPPVKARRARRNTHRVGETTSGREANAWESH